MSDCQAVGNGTDKFGEPASYGCTLEAPHEPPHIAHGAEGRELLRWTDADAESITAEAVPE